jgi:hypothetical protein
MTILAQCMVNGPSATADVTTNSHRHNILFAYAYMSSTNDTRYTDFL